MFRAAQVLRQSTLSQLQERLGQLLPPALLSSEDDGSNSRERAFPLRRKGSEMTIDVFFGI
jgi:hypothetical protein